MLRTMELPNNQRERFDVMQGRIVMISKNTMFKNYVLVWLFLKFLNPPKKNLQVFKKPSVFYCKGSLAM